jgi:hypothetical protein
LCEIDAKNNIKFSDSAAVDASSFAYPPATLFSFPFHLPATFRFAFRRTGIAGVHYNRKESFGGVSCKSTVAPFHFTPVHMQEYHYQVKA